jgi:hypothetical protein
MPFYHLHEQSIDWSAFMYFSLASILLLGNAFGYLMLKRLPITKYYESQGSKMVRPVLIVDSPTKLHASSAALRVLLVACRASISM